MLKIIKQRLALKLFVWAIKVDIKTIALCFEVLYEMAAEKTEEPEEPEAGHDIPRA